MVNWSLSLSPEQRVRQLFLRQRLRPRFFGPVAVVARGPRWGAERLDGVPHYAVPWLVVEHPSVALLTKFGARDVRKMPRKALVKNQ